MAKNKTEIHVTTVFDGELDATEVNWKIKFQSTQKLELSIAKYILEVSVANLLISSYSCGSAIESGWRYPMLAFIRDNNTAKSVTEIFDWLYEQLGHEVFTSLFQVILLKLEIKSIALLEYAPKQDSEAC